MAAIIHVKLTGEGDFGPVDLECAIPPARLPVVMAALFGQPLQMQAGQMPSNITTGSERSAAQNTGSVHSLCGQDAGAMASDESLIRAESDGQGAARSVDFVQGQAVGGAAYSADPGVGIDPGAFITSFMGSLGDLIGRLQPRGFAETILIAAIWLHYRDGRGFVSRDDIRRILRRQDHLRMPKNFSRDFHVAVTRGYLDPIENEDGFAVSPAGYQWFRSECTK